MFSAAPLPSGESPFGGSTGQPQKQEPGEFTRIFSAHSAPPKQPLPIATPQQSPTGQPSPFAPPTSPWRSP